MPPSVRFILSLIWKFHLWDFQTFVDVRISVLTWPGLPEDSCPLCGEGPSQAGYGHSHHMPVLPWLCHLVWLNRDFWPLSQHRPSHSWMKDSYQLRLRTGLGSSPVSWSQVPLCSVTSCVARGLHQAEPGPSISKLGDSQGCLSWIECWQFFRHFYHNIGIERSGQKQLGKKEASSFAASNTIFSPFWNAVLFWSDSSFSVDFHLPWAFYYKLLCPFEE